MQCPFFALKADMRQSNRFVCQAAIQDLSAPWFGSMAVRAKPIVRF